MNKYRCPDCGEECLTWKQRYYFGGRYNQRRIHQCNACDRYFVSYQKNKLGSGLFTFFITIPFLPLFYLPFINGFFIFLLLLYLYFFNFAFSAIRNVLFGAIIQYDEDKEERIMPIPNAEITLNQLSGKIRSLDIFGIKFCQETKNVRFGEAFTGNLVPVVFHDKSEETSQPMRITIMKKEFIPAELLKEGSPFVIINNGKEIAAGYISFIITET